MNKTGWIIAGIVIIALIILLIIPKKQKEFRVYHYPQTLVVENHTEFQGLDIISLTLAHMIFEMDSLELIIRYLPTDLSEDSDTIWKAFVHPTSFIPHKYLILISDKLSDAEAIKVLSHEFIHIYQMEQGYLEMIGNKAIWYGDTIDLLEIPYKKRPFEKEAFKFDDGIKIKLKELLYE